MVNSNIPFKVIIKEASAGTGKTYSIIEEILKYIKENGTYEILKNIISVTFTENAAIELKERLINTLINEFKNLPEKEKILLQNVLLKLNFSTLHSFAKKTLQRFYFILGIDPFFTVIDENISNLLFNEALKRKMIEISQKENFYELIKKIKLNNFNEMLFEVKKLHPYIFLGKPIRYDVLTENLSEIYREIEKEYDDLKIKLGYFDFNDLEKLLYKLINERPESWAILEDFDEKINFIFIDEFQDLNLLQWEIIKKLIEEWTSGYGAKVEETKSYGIYIVGDKKQSIYKFRGAEKEVFEEAKKTLSQFLQIEKLRKNYRSSQQIVDFVNNVFKEENEWIDEKLEYSGIFENYQSEIKICTFENKENEYEWICRKIYKLIYEKTQIFDKEENKYREIKFKDIMILIRKRNKNFKLLEEKLKEYNIPFVIIGGIGFYSESEIKFLLSLIYSLIDPSDYYSIWNLKNSIFNITQEKIEKWYELTNEYKFLELIEKILKEINFWENLNVQQKANVEKFLSIIQNYSSLPHFQILKNLKEMAQNPYEPKADIFSINQNAVKILTIHGAKGLESPVVFFPNIEDLDYTSKNDYFFYFKTEGGYEYIHKKESNSEEKERFINQMSEEEKRLLYVALTRARQFLYVSGVLKNKSNNLINKFLYFSQPYLVKDENLPKLKFEESPSEIPEEIKVDQLKFKQIKSFTKERKEKNITFKETIIGSILHKIINEISTDKILYDKDEIIQRIKFYLRKEVEKDEIERYLKEIKKILEKIFKNKEIEEIVKEKVGDNIMSEFSFFCEVDGKIYEGVMDKVFKTKNCVKIYEFKTFIHNLDDYKEQIEIYRKVAQKMFDKQIVECYIIDLSKGKIYKL